MHEELKQEFEERFINGIDYKNFPLVTNIWDWFESKLPKEVEIKLVEEQTYYRCPNCGIWISNADGADEEDDYTDNFCPNCGSKINWK